jgi:hypothetical protein
MQLCKFVKFREESFGGVLFETRSEKVYTLNQAAAAIVREIAAGGELAEAGPISQRLKTKFHDPADQLEQDVQALIRTLQQQGLVEEQP